jgi:hypothetical protein
MKENAVATASAMMSATFTVGTIQRGARAGTRTTLASTIDCLVRSARNQISFSRGGATTQRNLNFLRRAVAPPREKSSFKY